MSWYQCPECGGQTHKDGEPCRSCCDRHRDTTEIVDTICRQGDRKRRDPINEGSSSFDHIG